MSLVRRFFLPHKYTDDSSSAPAGNDPMSDEEARQARTLIEKKTVVNLLEAYAVAVKHYLRGEDGIHYEDLHPLVSFLHPYYLLPAIAPSANPLELHRKPTHASTSPRGSHDIPASPGSQVPLSTIHEAHSRTANRSFASKNKVGDEESIRLATLPPKRSWRVAFPFSFFLWLWATMKKDDRGGRGIRVNENNVPLEISLFLVCKSRCAKNSRPYLCLRRVLTSPHYKSVKLWTSQLQVCLLILFFTISDNSACRFALCIA